ncbi:MAG TPA: lamin tail domain-containing protein [Anaerolineae bacterium]|nr:lamin tail domain-containing protein [Anaerolineae bacterium]
MSQKSAHNLIILLVLFLLGAACTPPRPGSGGATPTAIAPAPSPTATLLSATPLATLPGLETVTVAQVVDGDTIELTNGRKVRYIGINTPERDQPYYAEAAAANRQLVAGKDVQLELDVETFDQYGRTLAYVWADGVMVNLEIVRQGYANTFTVPPNVRYEAQFRQAEQEAREAERGLWAGSSVALKIVQIQADAPGSDSENPNGEWIEIANQGSEPVPMQGYSLKDEANHIYTFGNFTVAPGNSFRLYSGQGQDSANELYWGFSGESVWNNNSDAAFLRDNEGALVDTFAY